MEHASSTLAGGMERAASVAAGGAVLAYALKRRGAARTVSALLGGGLLLHGMTGRPALLGGRDGARRPQKDLGRVVTVGRPAEELYGRWRDPAVLSTVFDDVLDVRGDGPDGIRVRASLPGGRATEWRSRLVEQHDDALLRWCTDAGAALPHAMVVRLRPAPAGWGTEVSLAFEPTSDSPLARIMAHALGFVPRTAAYKVLRRFKALAETGEMPTLKNNPAGGHRVLGRV